MRRLYSIRESEKEFFPGKERVCLFQAQFAVDPQPKAKQQETLPVTHIEGKRTKRTHTEGKRANVEERKLGTARTYRKNSLPPKPEVVLHNLSKRQRCPCRTFHWSAGKTQQKRHWR